MLGRDQNSRMPPTAGRPVGMEGAQQLGGTVTGVGRLTRVAARQLCHSAFRAVAKHACVRARMQPTLPWSSARTHARMHTCRAPRQGGLHATASPPRA